MAKKFYKSVSNPRLKILSMTRRAKRTVLIQQAWFDEENDSRIIYQIGENVPVSSSETIIYDSATIRQLWVLALEITHARTLELILKKDGDSGYNFIPPVEISPGTSTVNLVSLLPFDTTRNGIEMGLGFALKARLNQVSGSNGKIIVNGSVEEEGVAYLSNK